MAKKAADIILAAPINYLELIEKYKLNCEQRVELHEWVDQCVEKGSLVFTPPRFKKSPGGPAGA
jgi:hypothetical protein